MMESEVQAAMRAGSTSEPTLRAILFSQRINQWNSGPLVRPWELDDLPDEFLMAYEALFTSMRQVKQKANMEKYFLEARRKHPTYRKYVN